MDVVAVPPNHACVAEMPVVEAFAVNCWSAVHVFAFPRLSPIVRAVLPLYVPEKVRVESVAVRFARDTSEAETVAQVAAPSAESERTN